MSRMSLICLVTAVGLSACGGGSEEDGASPPTVVASSASSSPSATPSMTPSAATSGTPSVSPSATLPGATELGNDPKARKELRQAIIAMLRDNTGTYALDFGTTGDGVQERASFRIRPRAFEIRRYFSSPEGTYTFDFRAVGPSAWMRSVDKPGDGPRSWPCWVAMADLAEGAPDELGAFLTSEVARTQPPNAVIAASYGIGREYTEDETLGSIRGTIDLVMATSLMGSQAVLKLGLDPQSKATAPAYFDVRNGRLHGYTVGLRGLFLALEEQGADLPVDPSGMVPGSITVTFDDPGSPVSVAPPEPSQVVEIAPGTESFGDEMEACGDRQP